MSRHLMPSSTQIEKLIELLEGNRSLATGHARSSIARNRMRLTWQKIARSLNGQGTGCVKSWEQWSKYWRDKKGTVKRKASARHLARTQTDGGRVELPELSDIEERILALMGGERLATGDRNIVIDPLLPTTNINTNTERAPSSNISTNTENSESVLLEENIVNFGEPQPEPSVMWNQERPSNRSPDREADQERNDSNFSPPSRHRGSIRRRLLQRTPPFQHSQLVNFRERLIGIEERRVSTETRLSRILENSLSQLGIITERFIGIAERCFERETSLVRTLENIGQSWADQARSMYTLTESLQNAISKINHS